MKFSQEWAVAEIDLPTSRAQSVFFFFGSAITARETPKYRAGLPPEPEMRNEGLLRKSIAEM